jgi:cytochrome c-type biogenesis protein CcmF
VTGTKAAVGPPWFNRYTVPLALVLVLLSGVGPVIAWRRATPANARRSFAAPGALALLTLVVLLAAGGVAHKPAALALFVGAAFVLGAVAQEYWRGAGARRAMSGEPIGRAVISMVGRNRRRYGGYVVHTGMALLFVGVAASSAFQHARDVRLAPRQSATVGGYTVRYVRPTARIITDHGRVERIGLGAVLDVRRDGRRVAILRPERDFYPTRDPALGPLGRFFEGEATSEVGMRAGLRRDIWTAVTPDTSRLEPVIREGDQVFRKVGGSIPPAMQEALLGRALTGLVDRYRRTAPPATFRVIASPMVAWIWVGGLVVFLGGLIALWPGGPDALRRRVTAGYAARVARELSRA